MNTAHKRWPETGTRMDRVFSSEVIALLVDSASQHSRPGQPATPEQVLPFLNAASLHSSDAAALWRADSRDMSASQSKPPQPTGQLQEALRDHSGQPKQPMLSRELQHAQSAKEWQVQGVDTCPEQEQTGVLQSNVQSRKRLSAVIDASARLQDCLGDLSHPASRITEQLQASEHSAARTEISQSADDEGMHCCDSMASALAPLMRAHVRSKPALPAEVTDDSEDLSNSASDKALQLSLADLKAVFGVPLTEAAARLGVQRQDLVRSCRRHNLEGWPRLFISVTEAARSDASMPTSVPSDADASELAAFVPFGPSALRSAPLASQAHSVHTRSSSRVGGDRARASGASTRRKPASPGLEGHQQGEAAPKPSQQGSAKGGMLADPFPAATASLLDWTAAVSLGKEKASLLEAPLLLKVPAIKLDRPGMWAPKIAQSRARAQEATSLPRAPSDPARAAQDPAAAEEPAAAAVAVVAQQGPAALVASSDPGAGGDLRLHEATEAFPEQASKAPVGLCLQQMEAASSPERQLESRTVTAHPAASFAEPEQDTAAEVQQPAVPADTAQAGAAQLAAEGVPVYRRVQAQPAMSAPLQDSVVCHSKERRRANAALVARKALSSPLILSPPEFARGGEAAISAMHLAAEAEIQSKMAPAQVLCGSHGEQGPGAGSQPAPGIGPAPAADEAPTVAAHLMCSPFMQSLARTDSPTPSARLLGDTPVSLPACHTGAASPSDHRHLSPSYCSQDSQSAALPGKLTAADRCTGGSAELAKTKVRQPSRQNSALILPPKKRLQKRRCGSGTTPPSGEEPVAGQASHAAVTAARVSPSAAAASLAAVPAPVTASGKDAAEKPSAAEQLPIADGQTAEAQLAAAKQGSTAEAPVAAGKPRRRPGRPPGSGKAARARALELALPACSPEGRRPLKKSRKALEAEQAEEALQSLRKELPCLSEGEREALNQSEAPAAKKGCIGGSSDRQQPEEAPTQGQEEQRHASKIQLMPQTPTSMPRSIFLGSLRLPRPDLGKIGEDMVCSEKLPDHIPDALESCHNLCLNLSPPPALPGTTFCGSVCNSLLGSPLPHMDSPEYHGAFYGEALHDLSLGNFNDIADSSFSFGCFNN